MSHTKLVLSQNSTLFLILLSLFCVNACVSPTDANHQSVKTHARPLTSANTMNLKEYIVALFDSTATGPLQIAGDTIQHPETLQKAYIMHQFEPFWVNEQGLTTKAEEFINA